MQREVCTSIHRVDVVTIHNFLLHTLKNSIEIYIKEQSLYLDGYNKSVYDVDCDVASKLVSTILQISTFSFSISYVWYSMVLFRILEISRCPYQRVAALQYVLYVF